MLGVKEELNILKVLMAKMEEMEELQTLAKRMVQSEFNRGEPLIVLACLCNVLMCACVHSYILQVHATMYVYRSCAHK